MLQSMPRRGRMMVTPGTLSLGILDDNDLLCPAYRQRLIVGKDTDTTDQSTLFPLDDSNLSLLIARRTSVLTKRKGKGRR